MIAGVDEAGRGSVLGPLVIACVSMEESSVSKLVEIGVKDSKLLTPKKRKNLFSKIKKLSLVRWTLISPADIDKYVFNGEKLFKLNYLEAKHMARLLSQLKFSRAYVDCCDIKEQRFGRLIEDLIHSELQGSTPFQDVMLERDIKSEHHADRNYPIVSAASVVAKVVRDSHIEKLQRKHGLFGSGYPSDPETVEFLKGFISRSQKLPYFARTSWRTIERLNREIFGEFNESEKIDSFGSNRSLDLL